MSHWSEMDLKMLEARRRGQREALAGVTRQDSAAVQTLWKQLEKLAGWTKEVRFDPIRMWRFDFAHEELKIGVEVEGVLYGEGGRHQRVAGFSSDCDKYNSAQLAGWMVLRFVPEVVLEGRAVDLIQHAMRLRTKSH